MKREHAEPGLGQTRGGIRANYDDAAGILYGARMRAAVDSRIVGFHQDEELHWVAELECGHNQHVRHNPPWINRPWVITPEGRATAMGQTLACPLCDRKEAQ